MQGAQEKKTHSGLVCVCVWVYVRESHEVYRSTNGRKAAQSECIVVHAVQMGENIHRQMTNMIWP